ncbi:MAG: hypothetical protein ACJA2M_000474 [Polaribacter sp.]|jgi:hypothetical protein
MKKFILRFIVFLIAGYLVGEIVVRTNKLTSDVPQRFVDANGIQKYILGQKGFYKGSDEPWKVNEYGWIGVNNINNRPNRVSIIGDSYIENIMNPISCHQGYILQKLNENIDFFEAGRSGVTFIEAMEITKQLDSLKFDKHMLYISENDFEESFSNSIRYDDRTQFDEANNSLLFGNLKSPGLKKTLYNAKFLYYLYNRFPLFVSKQNKGEVKENVNEEKEIYNYDSFNKLFKYCKSNYELNKIILVFHPNTSSDITNFFINIGMQCIILEKEPDESWDLNGGDGHWSCYGHQEVSKQITKQLQMFNF